MLKCHAIIRVLTLSAGSLFLLCCSDATGTSKRYGGAMRITASAEALGASGYTFPPAPGQELSFVDGWEVRFDRIIAVIGNVRISETPDKNPGDQGDVNRPIVELLGSRIVDLKGTGTELDKGGAGKVAIRLSKEDLDEGFDLEQRYAFSYDLVPATSDAELVNVEPGDPDVAAMVTAQQRLLLTGTATFRGTDCTASDPSYDFSTIPKMVKFRFGFTGTVTYANCQNPDNQGSPIEGEESQRGVQLLPNAVTIAQITIHTDHVFWSTIAHENLPLFNQFALNAAVSSDSTYAVTLDGLANVPVPSVTDRNRTPIPWRSCVASSLYVLPPSPSAMTFDTGSQAISNLRQFVEFNARTMGHLNADGLCYVKE